MNNEPDVSDELKVLASIYCKDGEFLLDEESYGLGELSFTVNLEDVGKMISFSCQLNKDYPTSLPILHVSRPTLKRSEFESFRKDLTAFLETNSLINQPMLTELIEWVRRHVANYETSSHQLAAEMKQLPTASTHLLQLDHMRSKSKLYKTTDNQLYAVSLFNDQYGGYFRSKQCPLVVTLQQPLQLYASDVRIMFWTDFQSLERLLQCCCTLKSLRAEAKGPVHANML
ncbi:unnamed protein product [Clavelina lepadiformis]|uniref:RWD domain-containing protein 3 n=1 Tax=Clavelina lepadiformis TaxID=159417 RepID=A0ABP0GFS7_CLALP